MSGGTEGFGGNEEGGATAECPLKKKAHWIEIVLVGEDSKPIPGVAYRVTLPDGETVVEGALDAGGKARIDGLAAAGECIVTFPGLDENAWEPASRP
jgi:hypothetical protein